MNLQVLVATMHQEDHSLLEKMNINSDAIIVNQCGKNEYENIEYNGHDVKIYSFSERGVGLNRNNSLMRATADICLFSDDDVIYDEKYKDIIINEFKANPKADVIIFNVLSTNKDRKKKIIKERRKLNYFNCFNYPTYQIAVKNNKIRKANIFFSLLFGGGTSYGSGEDSLFLRDCYKKGLNIYSSPEVIGEVKHDSSTWFKGFNEKYFIDKGTLYAALFNKYARLFSLRFILKHKNKFEGDKSFLKLYKLMLNGIKDWRR